MASTGAAAPQLTVAVLLAAGGGSRFSGSTHKLLAPLEANTVVGQALDAALSADIGPIVIVTGAVDLDHEISAAQQRSNGSEPSSITVVRNEDWAAGQATSLRCAIECADQLGADAVVVGLADQPYIDAQAWQRVAASTAPIGIATYDGHRRNPVRLHRSVWDLLPARGDQGARSLSRVRPDLVDEVPCPGSPADIDTLEDLPSWPNRSSTNSP